MAASEASTASRRSRALAPELWEVAVEQRPKLTSNRAICLAVRLLPGLSGVIVQPLSNHRAMRAGVTDAGWTEPELQRKVIARNFLS